MKRQARTLEMAEIKRTVVHFLRRGQMTIAQAAEHSGVHRATIWEWAKAAHIDVETATRFRLQSLWRSRVMSYRTAPRSRNDTPAFEQPAEQGEALE